MTEKQSKETYRTHIGVFLLIARFFEKSIGPKEFIKHIENKDIKNCDSKLMRKFFLIGGYFTHLFFRTYLALLMGCSYLKSLFH
jgi:hypothetical protein